MAKRSRKHEAVARKRERRASGSGELGSGPMAEAQGKLTMEMLEKYWARLQSIHRVPVLDMTLEEFLTAPMLWPVGGDNG